MYSKYNQQVNFLKNLKNHKINHKYRKIRVRLRVKVAKNCQKLMKKHKSEKEVAPNFNLISISHLNKHSLLFKKVKMQI